MSTELLKSMLSGMEDLNDGIMSEDSIYVSAIMGGEGFMDSIKKGAKSALAFIKMVINNIIDAVLMWFGGRSRIERGLEKLKNSKLFEMFKPKIAVLISKYSIPAANLARRHIESGINEEYQSFFRGSLPESPEITKFFVSINSMDTYLEKFIRNATGSNSEQYLSFSEILGKAKEAMEAGRKIVSLIEKEKEPNDKVIQNLNSVVGKVARAVTVLTNASDSIARNIDKESK